jgi:hypothetical protein
MAEHGVGIPEVPAGLVAQFAHTFAVVQQETAKLWTLAAQMHGTVGAECAEFVGDDLALVMNVHPATGSGFVDKAVHAGDLPGLMEAWRARELTERHVNAILDEVGKWADSPAQRARVVELALERTRAWVAMKAGRSWPTPGDMRKRIRTAAVLLDCTAPEKAKRSVEERRRVELYPSGVGEGTLTVQGPEGLTVRMHDAIRARAEALGQLPGDERTLDQRMYDAALELLCVDADTTEPGEVSKVPTTDAEGAPVPIRPRGVRIQVIAPVSVLRGGDHELAEIPGYGPILPSTARDLTAMAEQLQRVLVDAQSGEVLEAGDPVPIKTLDVTSAILNDSERWKALTMASFGERLEQLLTEKIRPRQESSESYRPPRRLRRHVEARDRTCTFPGCSRPACDCDLDHRKAFPAGATHEHNLAPLCRHHHRCKQAYFDVSICPATRDILWTTPDGRQYRRPPPEY